MPWKRSWACLAELSAQPSGHLQDFISLKTWINGVTQLIHQQNRCVFAFVCSTVTDTTLMKKGAGRCRHCSFLLIFKQCFLSLLNLCHRCLEMRSTPPSSNIVYRRLLRWTGETSQLPPSWHGQNLWTLISPAADEWRHGSSRGYDTVCSACVSSLCTSTLMSSSIQSSRFPELMGHFSPNTNNTNDGRKTVGSSIQHWIDLLPQMAFFLRDNSFFVTKLAANTRTRAHTYPPACFPWAGRVTGWTSPYAWFIGCKRTAGHRSEKFRRFT